MKILRLEAENIKKLKVVAIKPDGNVVEITGANGSGKTSVLDSIYYALAGAKDIPSQPIRRGQLKAHVTLDLGDFSVTRKFSKDAGTSLVVEAKNGARYPTPQRLLDEMLGKLTFDPLEFSRMDPKKQLEQIRSMVALDVDLDEIDRLNKTDFDARTEVNREIKKLDAQAYGIQFAADTPDEEIDVSKLSQELADAAIANAKVLRANQAIEDGKREIARNRGEVQKFRADAAELRREAEALEKTADMLEESIAGKEKNLGFVKVGELVDVTELRELIDQAGAVNAEVAKKRRQAEIFEEAKKKRTEAEFLSNAIDARTKQKQDAIKAAKMPIAGLEFGEAELLLNGIPLVQASSAEQLRLSVAVAMAANPKLKVLRIQDGSLLDERSMVLLGEMAEASDYQIWIERVDTSGKVGVVMEDGAVKEVITAGGSK